MVNGVLIFFKEDIMKQKNENINKNIKKQAEFKPKQWVVDLINEHRELVEGLKNR